MTVTPLAEGPRLVAAAEEAGIALRLFGGVATWHRSSARTRSALGRPYADVDFVAHHRGSRPLHDLLDQERYEPERMFNATHGARRLLYHASDGSFHIDVFLDRFEMSHQLDFEDRLELEPLTLSAADLLLAKLQVAEITHKDLTDSAMVLLHHSLDDADGSRVLNAGPCERVVRRRLETFTTATGNLDKLAEMTGELGLSSEEGAEVVAAVGALRARMDDAPKSRAWKLRARIGRRKRRYETPEEVQR